MKKLKFLHVGCGPKSKEHTTKVFNSDVWDEIRFDIDNSHNPDILGSMTDMSMLENNSVDAIFSSHNIEHLYFHEAELAIKEFFRVLKPSGYVFLLCPDIISVCNAIVEKGPYASLYNTSAGLSISPIDVIYGWRTAIRGGNDFMAHKFGYSEKTLINLFREGGFSNTASTSRASHYDIVLLACRENLYTDKSIENNKKNINKLFMDHIA